MAGAVFDMGGVREWFGPIPVEANEPVFDHPWESRIFGAMVESIATLGFTEEGFRWATERLPRAQYVTTYYRRWIATLEEMAIDKDVLAPGELDAHLAGEPPKAHGDKQPGRLHRDAAREAVRTAVGPMPAWKARLGARIEGTHLPEKARFAIGDHVTVSSATPDGHTRRPRYTWGKPGTIVDRHFAAVLPERSARGEHGDREHVYTVEFDGRDLWGDDAEPGTAVRIGLWESYLEATS